MTVCLCFGGEGNVRETRENMQTSHRKKDLIEYFLSTSDNMCIMEMQSLYLYETNTNTSAFTLKQTK